ncbi:conjugal transfer protein MobC [Alistipes putredinis]|uniref:conjugal transfer protein MobC n=1 Tax=Alistipes putredinis TaxID=28117 RepID=UPI003AB14910
MQQEDDLRALEKVVQCMRGISVIFLFSNIYWFGYEWFVCRGWTNAVVDDILRRFQAETGLFSHAVTTKLCALVLLAVGCYGTKSVRDNKVSGKRIALAAAAGALLFFGCDLARIVPGDLRLRFWGYVLTLAGGYLLLLAAGVWIGRRIGKPSVDDPFNEENESFMQETRLLENEYSVNLPTRFCYDGQSRTGWINVVNPFRATVVLGTPGSGKSYAVINSYIRQHIEKGFAMYIYDFKFDDLSTIAYNHLLRHLDKYEVKPKFCVINFDDPRRSNRCNPLDARFMTDISDAFESSYVILLNLNKTWAQREGDFFSDSAIVLLAAIIWYLKIYDGGRYCTFPHAIELLCQPYEKVFPVLASYPELENYLSPFMDAWQSNAQDQLQGQVASAKIPLTRIISPQLYWVMTGSDFTLDINNPEAPKILCIGNNPDRQNIYSAALGLYNSRIVRLINRKGRLKSSVIIDELPTIYFRGLDNLIATARSNKVSVCLGFQDFSQLERDYGDKEAKVIINTVGNIFSGQVVGDTARTLSERFGKIVQRRESYSVSTESVTTSTSTQLDTLIPPSKISTLTQGVFVGAVADNIDQPIEQKIFHARIEIDSGRLKAETASYVPIPEISSFVGEDGTDHMERIVKENYYRIKAEVRDIIRREIARIEKDPQLQKLLPGKK